MKINALKKWFVTVSQYAKFKHITPQAVRKAIAQNRLDAKKVGSQWLIPKQDERRE